MLDSLPSSRAGLAVDKLDDRVQPISFPVSGRVFAAAFSPASDLRESFLALGLRSSVLILQVSLPEEEDPSEKVDVQVWKELNHDGRVQCLAWSFLGHPVSSPGFLRLVTGGADGKVRVFRLNHHGGKEDEVQTLHGHTDYVNSVAFQPESCEQVASASDDCSLILHILASGQRHVVTFGSPVMSVAWHPAEEAKLMAAEKRGLIHIFNTITYQPILSFDSVTGPLLSADWSLKNSLYIMAAVRSEILVWDISRPCTPVLKKSLHEDGVRDAKFANTSDCVIATTGQPNYSVKIFNAKSSQFHFSSADDPVGGIAWHPRLNYLAVGRDESVTLHYVSLRQ